MSLLKIYIQLLKGRVILSPLLLGIILGSMLSVDNPELEVTLIMLVYLIPFSITQKEYNLLSTLPMKTQDILKIKYINSYVQVIIAFLIGGMALAYRGRLELVYFIYRFFIVLVEVNILLIAASDRGLKEKNGAGAVLITILIITITMGLYFIGIGTKELFVNNILSITIAEIIAMVLSLFLSYKVSSSIVYG